MKPRFVIPPTIKLMAVEISVVFTREVEKFSRNGNYDPATNCIYIMPDMSEQSTLEVFCHELSEAMCDKFVNQQEKTADEVPHTVRDAYGRALFNFLVENVPQMLEVGCGKKRAR